MPNSIFLRFQKFEEFWNRFIMNRCWFGKRSSFIGDTVNATMISISAGVTKIMLHMADDGVLPIKKPKSAIRSGFDIRRPEGRIRGRKNGFKFGALETSTIFFDLVSHDALIANHIRNNVVVLKFFREVITSEELRSGARPGALFVNSRCLTMLLGEIQFG